MNIRPIPVIAMTPCTSSNVKSHGYDADSQTLAVKFRASGATYHYANVPPEVYDELAASPSVGSFISRSVRPIYDGVQQASEAVTEHLS